MWGRNLTYYWKTAASLRPSLSLTKRPSHSPITWWRRHKVWKNLATGRTHRACWASHSGRPACKQLSNRSKRASVNAETTTEISSRSYKPKKSNGMPYTPIQSWWTCTTGKMKPTIQDSKGPPNSAKPWKPYQSRATKTGKPALNSPSSNPSSSATRHPSRPNRPPPPSPASPTSTVGWIPVCRQINSTRGKLCNRRHCGLWIWGRRGSVRVEK